MSIKGWMTYKIIKPNGWVEFNQNDVNDEIVHLWEDSKYSLSDILAHLRKGKVTHTYKIGNAEQMTSTHNVFAALDVDRPTEEKTKSFSGGQMNIQNLPKSADETQAGGSHYKNMSIQPWTVMEAWLTPEEFKGYLKGSILKYSGRSGAGKEPERVQLEKLHHYSQKLQEFLKQHPYLCKGDPPEPDFSTFPNTQTEVKTNL